MKIRLDDELRIGWHVIKKNPPVLSAALIAKAVFQLKPGKAEFWPEADFTLVGDIYDKDDPNRCLRDGSDLAPFKPRADVLVVGNAHAPRGTPVTNLPVRIAVGKLSKTIEVIGNRTWKNRLLGTLTPPEPFMTMPLGYENAFGGPGDPKNPVGKGRQEDLPNLENPRRKIIRPTDSPDPVGFGPIAAGWLPRANLLGTYDQKWLEERWPWFPHDFDWSHFNAAPRDQQVEDYLRGDEELELENLHPEQPLYRSRLPGRRVRWFIEERTKDGPTQWKEVPLHLDTVWIDMEALQLVLVRRGLADVQSVRLNEIQQMFVVTEPLAEPKSPEHYREELRRRLEAEDAPDPAETEANKAMAEAEKQWATQEAEMAALKEQKGSAPAPASPARPRPIDEGIAVLAADLAQMHQAGVPPHDPRRVETEGRLAELERLRDELPDDTPLTRELVQEGASRGESFAGRNLSELDLSGLELAGLDFREALMCQTNLVGTNLANANLTGAILQGADLTGVNLTGANLNDAILLEARLGKARLTGVSLADAMLSNLDLQGADFSQATGRGADFREAQLNGARFTGAKLPGADFSASKLEGANFAAAELQRAMFDGARTPRINMEAADITGLQCSDKADFTEGIFRKVKGNGSVWEAARLDRADFSGALLERSIFTEASLQEACCDRAHLMSADLADASLERAVLTRANLLRASLDRANLTEADFQDANLYEAGFHDAVTDDANFRGANLKGTLLR